jgi:hypothetical protein
MDISHRPFLIWAKLFAFNCARTPKRANKLLILYNLCWVGLYATVLYFRFAQTWNRKLQSMNNVVLYLQLSSYVITFLSNFISNWLNSKKFLECFKKLTGFDENLLKLGHYPNNRKIRNVFYISLFFTLVLFLYFIIVDYVLNVFVNKNITSLHWLSFYLPVTTNYFFSYFVVMSLYFLHVRYSLLVQFLEKVQRQGPFSTENLLVIRSFVKLFSEMVNITNSMIPLFSLPICTLFILASLTVTNNLFLVFKGKFNFTQNLVLINVVILHMIEIFVVVLAHYQIHRKVSFSNYKWWQ